MVKQLLLCYLVVSMTITTPQPTTSTPTTPPSTTIHIPTPPSPGAPPPQIYPPDVVTSNAEISCTNQGECPSGYACRDSSGNIIASGPGGYGGPGGYSDLGGHGGSGGPEGPPQGTCGCATRPGEVCEDNKDCPQDYKCYRQVQGICCQPKHCYTKEYVQYWDDYWSNCFPPHCHFPAK